MGRSMSSLRQVALRRVAVLSFVLLALGGCGQGKVLEVGDMVPWQTRRSDASVWLVAKPGDCFGCSLAESFIALRSLQRESARENGSDLTVFVVSSAPTDTIAFSDVLRSERIVARIATIPPDTAAKYFRVDRLPSIVLLRYGRIVRVWQTEDGRRLMIERDEISAALNSKE